MGEGMRGTKVSSSRKRVLVVGDDCLIALMLAEQLSEIGYIVVGPAFELKEARQLAEVSSIDAALLDLNLHGLFAGQVADILARRQILFLFITGYDRPPAGFHENIGFLNKPFQTAELRRAVEGLLSFPANSDRRRSGAA